MPMSEVTAETAEKDSHFSQLLTRHLVCGVLVGSVYGVMTV